MATGNSKAAVGKSGTNQSMILSADLEREIAAIAEKNRMQTHIWSNLEVEVINKYKGQVSAKGICEILKKIFPDNARYYTQSGVASKIKRSI